MKFWSGRAVVVVVAVSAALAGGWLLQNPAWAASEKVDKEKQDVADAKADYKDAKKSGDKEEQAAAKSNLDDQKAELKQAQAEDKAAKQAPSAPELSGIAMLLTAASTVGGGYWLRKRNK